MLVGRSLLTAINLFLNKISKLITTHYGINQLKKTITILNSFYLIIIKITNKMIQIHISIWLCFCIGLPILSQLCLLCVIYWYMLIPQWLGLLFHPHINIFVKPHTYPSLPFILLACFFFSWALNNTPPRRQDLCLDWSFSLYKLFCFGFFSFPVPQISFQMYPSHSTSTMFS